MKAPEHRAKGPREFVHHVKTERGISTYQIKRGMGDAAEVVAAVAIMQKINSNALEAYCTLCSRGNCQHAVRVLERANSGR